MSKADLHVKLAGGQQIVGGYSTKAYSIPTGSFTVNPLKGNYQRYDNIGAITITAPTVEGAVDILMVMNSGAGTVSFSGFTVGTVGDTLTYTLGALFIISIRKISTVSTYLIKALQ